MRTRSEAIFKIKKISSVTYTNLVLPRGIYELLKLSFILSCYNLLSSASKIIKSILYKLTPEVIFSFSMNNSYIYDVEEVQKYYFSGTKSRKHLHLSLCGLLFSLNCVSLTTASRFVTLCAVLQGNCC